MASIIKPRSLGLLSKTERRPGGASFIVSALAMFDLAQPDPDRLEGEQALWLATAKELPAGTVLDIGMPKPTAELLIGGHAAAPGGEPAQRMGLSWALGPLTGRLLVTGDRYWRIASGTTIATDPVPFVQMPLAPARCFGGPGHPLNAAGTGFRAEELLRGHGLAALPNIERPEQALRSIADQPAPARFGPLPLDSQERLRYAGTYDADWVKTRAPLLPEDADPRVFLLGPPECALPAHLTGDEPYALQNFAADAAEIRARLPGFRVRCFAGWVDPAKPVVELAMRIDTLWLLAGARRGILIYRGSLPVEDIEGLDVADIMLAYERMTDEPRPLSHYLEVRRLRTDPENAFKYMFAEHQLTPERSQAVLDAKAARRKALAAERRVKRDADMRWVAAQMMRQSGLPREMWPAFEPPPASEDDDLPMPTPEELAAGEVDLAELLDGIEAIQRKQEAQLDKLVQDSAPLMQEMARIAAGEAEPEAIDRLLAMLERPELAGQIDAEIAQMPQSEALPIDPADPAGAEALAMLDKTRDWRAMLLAGAAPAAIDEEAQFVLARARFLGLPEGGPLAAVRAQLAESNFALPPELDDLELPQAGPESAESAFDADLDEALRALESPNVPEGAAEQVREGMGKADAELAKLLPNLAPDGGSPVAALVALRRQPEPAPGAPLGATLDGMRGKLAEARDTAQAEIDRAEAQLLSALAAMRAGSPVPMKPDEPLTAVVATRLGTVIAEQARAGLSLAGRDFAGADLRGADLSGADLTGALMENARLDGARLTGANLTGATLCAATLDGTDFSGADLTQTNFSKARGRSARFSGARFTDALVMEAALPQAAFDGAMLSELQMMMSDLSGATFTGAQISNWIAMRCDLTGSDWRRARIERLLVMDAPLTGASFAEAALSESGFTLVRADGADFSGAVFANVGFAGDIALAGARFDRCTGEGLSFVKAVLTGASFNEARLSRLCFVESGLGGAAFRRATLRRALFSRNDLKGSDFFAADLLEAPFGRADLTGASFRGANLFGADLNDAALHGADLNRANLGRTILAVASDVA